LSLGRDMLRAAKRATDHLGRRSLLVGRFVRSCVNPDGGWRGRGYDSDLYFTVFALSCLRAMGRPVPAKTSVYLEGFADGSDLDLVHLACLARCWSLVRKQPKLGVADSIRTRIESFRCSDGGYNQSPEAETGTAYGCFLAIGAYQDLGSAMASTGSISRCLHSLRATDGGYGNLPGTQSSSVPATAAAVVALAQLRRGADALAGNWLADQCLPSGGFCAIPQTPLPDILSTATALFALSLSAKDISPIGDRCLAFVEGLWDARGGFRANHFDDQLDCEHTFYGLLAMGLLTRDR